MPLLKLKDVYFAYITDNENSFRLEISDLKVDQGEFISILGPNGSGKSTLMKLMTALINPVKGSISLEGSDYKSISARQLAQKIAFVPQATFSIYPFSVYEIVMMGRTPYLNFFGYESDNDREIVYDALKTVGVYELKSKGINEISGGEAQRVFIARALAQQPEIIFLDEPNAHLDIEHQISIFNLLKKFNTEKKMTVISVSHDLNLAGFYSKRVILMNKGRIVCDDEKSKILTEENIKQIFNVNSTIHYFGNNNSVSVVIQP